MLNIDNIKQQLEYIEETGWLRWKRTGKIAGCIDTRGYILVRINGILYLAHRIIWALKIGEQPPALIDHDDEDKSNNRWNNLVASSPSGNGYNRSKSKGIYQTPAGKWVAAIHSYYGKSHIGTYDSEEEARAAYVNRRNKLLNKERQL